MSEHPVRTMPKPASSAETLAILARQTGSATRRRKADATSAREFGAMSALSYIAVRASDFGANEGMIAGLPMNEWYARGIASAFGVATVLYGLNAAAHSYDRAVARFAPQLRPEPGFWLYNRSVLTRPSEFERALGVRVEARESLAELTDLPRKTVALVNGVPWTTVEWRTPRGRFEYPADSPPENTPALHPYGEATVHLDVAGAKQPIETVMQTSDLIQFLTTPYCAAIVTHRKGVITPVTVFPGIHANATHAKTHY